MDSLFASQISFNYLCFCVLLHQLFLHKKIKILFHCPLVFSYASKSDYAFGVMNNLCNWTFCHNGVCSSRSSRAPAPVRWRCALFYLSVVGPHLLITPQRSVQTLEFMDRHKTGIVKVTKICHMNRHRADLLIVPNIHGCGCHASYQWLPHSRLFLGDSVGQRNIRNVAHVRIVQASSPSTRSRKSTCLRAARAISATSFRVLWAHFSPAKLSMSICVTQPMQELLLE